MPQNAQRSSNSNSFQFYSVSPKFPRLTKDLYPIHQHYRGEMSHAIPAISCAWESVLVSAAAQTRQVCYLAIRAECPAARAQVNVGPTHNIFLSSYIDYTTGSAQYNWLLNDLQSIDRSKTPW